MHLEVIDELFDGYFAVQFEAIPQRKLFVQILYTKQHTYYVYESANDRLAVDMDIHGYIHGYIYVWISDFSHP